MTWMDKVCWLRVASKRNKTSVQPWALKVTVESAGATKTWLHPAPQRVARRCVLRMTRAGEAHGQYAEASRMTTRVVKVRNLWDLDC